MIPNNTNFIVKLTLHNKIAVMNNVIVNTVLKISISDAPSNGVGITCKDGKIHDAKKNMQQADVIRRDKLSLIFSTIHTISTSIKSQCTFMGNLIGFTICLFMGTYKLLIFLL